MTIQLHLPAVSITVLSYLGIFILGILVREVIPHLKMFDRPYKRSPGWKSRKARW